MKNYIFKPGWVPSICVGLLIPLFVSLGLWQLRRAEEKIALTAQREQRRLDPPVLLGNQNYPLVEYRYRRVEVSGLYDEEHQILLDNQVFNQKAGYYVLTPLRIDGSDTAVLVNRGWVPLGSDRNQRPQLAIGNRKVRVVGVIDAYPGVGFKLKGAEIPAPGWPALVQLLDAGRLSERLGYRLLPYQVLLDPEQGEGYQRAWRQASLQPEKNRGYALQWFSFALVLAVVYLWYGFKPKLPPTGLEK